MIGRTLSHYKIVERLGRGGMGEVFLAEDTKLKRKVALKVLRKEMAADPQRLRRFQREAEAVAALDHPNIVTIHSVDEAEGVHFLTMSLVDGVSLDRKIPEGGLPLPELFDVAIGVAEALAAAHERGITHRDLKPGNVMLSDDGRVRVLDFGLAKLQRDPETDGPADALTETLTGEGLLVGTVPYMAPEQLTGGAVDHRTDIYSLGVLLYEMASGRRPFHARSSAELVSSILRDEPSPVTDLADVPHHLGRIIKRCLEKDPRNRFQSALDLAYELRDLREAVASGAERPAPRVAAAGPARRPAWQWVAAAAAGLAVLLAGGWTVWKLVGPGDESGAGRAARPGADRRPAIAVLPLANDSGDPGQEYFVDGMTEALITDLAKIGGLRVISRGSVMRYRGGERPPPEIAAELGVRYLLEGSVLQAGGRVRVTAKLIDASGDESLWAESYEEDLTDVLGLQGRVARAVAEEVRVQLSPQESEWLAAGGPVDSEAYRFYLQGRYFWNRRTPEDFGRALELFDQAIERDPGFAPAWAGRADSLILLGEHGALPPREAFPRAREAARRAIELDERLAEAHASLGEIAHFFDWNPQAAAAHFRRALELNPSYATAYQRYAETFTYGGRSEEAYEALGRARELDPLSGIIRYREALEPYFERRFGRSINLFRRAIDEQPGFWLHHWGLANALMAVGSYDDALAEARRAAELSRDSVLALGGLGAAHALASQPAEARGVARRLEEMAGSGYVSPLMRAWVYLGLKERDRVFELLDEALRVRDPMMILLGAWPAFDDLRSDPRFERVLAAIGPAGAG